MPVLNWIGKEAVVNHDKEVPFKLLKKNRALSTEKDSQNLIIHGDNLEALKALMPFYYGNIKCIYIDPPYNTGNEGWVYNDKVNSPKIKQWLGRVVGRESEDLTRHDKWLCMMYPRLKLLKDLLSEDGAIFVSIDDHEIHNLRIIMDEIFGEENFIVNIIWEKLQTRKNSAKYFSESHEYVLCFAKNINKFQRRLIPREDDGIYKNPDNDPRGPWKLDRTYANNPYSADYKIQNPEGKMIAKPQGKYWRYSEASIQKFIEEGRLIWSKNGGLPHVKRYLSEVQQGLVPVSIFDRDFAGDNGLASRELSEILGSDKVFSYPKPTKLIKRLLQTCSQGDGDIILDSFAGTGTTAQAVMDVNKEDGGSRKFILIEIEDHVAKDITTERVKRSIEKYDYGVGFEYCELDKPLFNEKGQIEETCEYNQLASSFE